MLLAVDVGNSETVIGLFEDGAPELVDHWRVATNAERTSDEMALLVQEFLAFAYGTAARLGRWSEELTRHPESR